MPRIGKDALVKAPETVDCTLENGAVSRCVKLVVRHKSTNLKIGPFYPATRHRASLQLQRSWEFPKTLC